ncbi:MAG: beta-eliminating lyase-related protein [archaeon]|nr:beta-eliminating lyase-related protein [archaeon]
MAKSRILKLVSAYDNYRNSTLNLIPSENVLSHDVLKALASGMASRYSGRPESYGGAKIFQELWTNVEELAIEIFHCGYATVLPVSGHIAGMIAIDSLCKNGTTLATIAAHYGGYMGYNSGHIPEVMRMNVSYLPFDVKSWNIDLPRALEQLEKDKPSLVILGATVFLFPHPVKEIAKIVHSYGGKLIYDGSHVLGLIAGGCFQDPLREGADVLLGSTHKTLFGPQGGLILTNDKDIAMKIEQHSLYTFVDNFHLNRVAALGVALEEVKIHRRFYAKKVVQNSKALATALFKEGIPVEGKKNGFTRSHQIFLNYGKRGTEIREILETNGIISDSRIRLGTNEVTRKGMATRDMSEIAHLISQTLSEPNSMKVRRQVRMLISRYQKIRYTLNS